MRAVVWMMAGSVMVTAGCSMFSRDKSAACDSASTCVSAGTAACASGAIQIAPSAHPDSRNWRSLFDLNLSNAVFTKGVWFYDAQGHLTANRMKRSGPTAIMKTSCSMLNTVATPGQ